MGKSNQNKQCQQISSFCLISFFLNFQRTHDRFPNRKLYFQRFQIIIFETLKKRKSDKKQVFADIVDYDLIYQPEKKKENSFTYSSITDNLGLKFAVYNQEHFQIKSGL